MRELVAEVCPAHYGQLLGQLNQILVFLVEHLVPRKPVSGKNRVCSAGRFS